MQSRLAVGGPSTRERIAPPNARRYCVMITRLRIAGMTCQRCVQAVFTALTPVQGIVTAQVSVGAATIEHDGRATVDALRDAIAVSGYEVSLAEEDRRMLPVL